MKLSKTQLDVLTRMAEGWELLDLYGLQKGGDKIKVSSSTALVLWKKELIAFTGYSSPVRFILTDKGRHALSQ